MIFYRDSRVSIGNFLWKKKKEIAIVVFILCKLLLILYLKIEPILAQIFQPSIRDLALIPYLYINIYIKYIYIFEKDVAIPSVIISCKLLLILYLEIEPIFVQIFQPLTL